MSNYERIKGCVQSSSMSAEDKQTLIDIFAEVADENLIDIADLLEKKPEWITIFNDNRKKKTEAYASGNESAWNEILEEEKKYLNDLTFGLD